MHPKWIQFVLNVNSTVFCPKELICFQATEKEPSARCFRFAMECAGRRQADDRLVCCCFFATKKSSESTHPDVDHVGRPLPTPGADRLLSTVAAGERRRSSASERSSERVCWGLSGRARAWRPLFGGLVGDMWELLKSRRGDFQETGGGGCCCELGLRVY